MTLAYRPTPLAEAWQAVVVGRVPPRIALANFLDDWRRFPDPSTRQALIVSPLPDSGDPVVRRWSAYAAAAVEHLARRDGVPLPAWVEDPRWVLPSPWFPNPYWKLRLWQLVATPPAWKRRRIFGGDETDLIGRV
jgi:hypothetical protein